LKARRDARHSAVHLHLVVEIAHGTDGGEHRYGHSLPSAQQRVHRRAAVTPEVDRPVASSDRGVEQHRLRDGVDSKCARHSRGYDGHGLNRIVQRLERRDIYVSPRLRCTKVRPSARRSVATYAARGKGKRSAKRKRGKVRCGIHHVGAVIVDPHGATRGNGDTRAGRRLDQHRVSAGVVDDVDFLDAGYDEVASGTSSGPDQVKPHVAGGLRRVGIRQRKRDVGTSKSYVRRANNSFLNSSPEVDVRDVTPRGEVLASGHQLELEVAVSARHL